MRLSADLFFACRYPVVPISFSEKVISSPLNGFGSFVENQLTVDVHVNFWSPDSISWTYGFILTPASVSSLLCVEREIYIYIYTYI